MTDGHGVELGRLTETGGAIVDLADEARHAMSEFTGSVERHGGANEGFATTSTLSSLASMWQFQIDDLCKRTAVAGGLLQEADGSYEEFESEITETLDGLGAGEGD